MLARNAPAEKRISLVIGNAGYRAGALNTPANDAGLIAQTLQAAGLDVVGHAIWIGTRCAERCGILLRKHRMRDQIRWHSFI